MSIAQYLDTLCAEAELHPLDRKDDSTSFVRGEIDQIAYKYPGDEDFSYITANTGDDEIDQLAEHITATHKSRIAPPTAQLGDYLKQCRDDMQLAGGEGDAE